MKRWLGVVALPLVMTACVGGGLSGAAPTPAAAASHGGQSPTAASGSPSPVLNPAGGDVGNVAPYAVLVDSPPASTSYTISVVNQEGSVQRSLHAAQRTAIGTGAHIAVDLPYVSTSGSALYYLDGDSTLRAVTLHGLRDAPKMVANLGLQAGSEAGFAVSADDSRIAVAVLDFTRTPVHVLLYTDSLAGGNRKVIFESDSDYVWPVGWHQGLLVLAHAYAPYVDDALKAAPARDNPYWAVSYHLVDPATANREVLMGACTVSGPLTAAGSGCIQGGSIDWAGSTRPWNTHDWGSISATASLSPDGSYMAAADPDRSDRIDIWRADGTIATSFDGPGPEDWAGWFDNHTLLVSSATRQDWRTRILAIGPDASPAVVYVQATGYFAALLPSAVG